MSLAVLLIAAPSAQARTGEEVPLSILNTSPLTASGEKGKDEVEVKFTILNSSAESIHVDQVKFQAATSEALEVGTWDPKDIPPEEAVRLAVTLTGVKGLSEEVTGQLVVKSKELPVAQALAVTPSAPDDPWPAVLVFLALGFAAVAAVGVRGVVGKATMTEPVPDPKWSFSSWATTLTAAGAAFGVVLGGVTYPSFPHHVSKVELTNLNVLFGLLLVVGPFLYEALRRYVPKPDGIVVKRPSEPPGDDKPKREGRKWMLLIASFFTLWAVLGQIGALGLLGSELVAGFWEWVCIGAALVAAAFAMKYFFDTAREQLETDWEEKPAKAEGAGSDCCQPKPRSWSLL